MVSMPARGRGVSFDRLLIRSEHAREHEKAPICATSRPWSTASLLSARTFRDVGAGRRRRGVEPRPGGRLQARHPPPRQVQTRARFDEQPLNLGCRRASASRPGDVCALCGLWRRRSGRRGSGTARSDSLMRRFRLRRHMVRTTFCRRPNATREKLHVRRIAPSVAIGFIRERLG